jgi:hypothetical protein
VAYNLRGIGEGIEMTELHADITEESEDLEAGTQ